MSSKDYIINKVRNGPTVVHQNADVKTQRINFTNVLQDVSHLTTYRSVALSYKIQKIQHVVKSQDALRQEVRVQDFLEESVALIQLDTLEALQEVDDPSLEQLITTQAFQKRVMQTPAYIKVKYISKERHGMMAVIMIVNVQMLSLVYIDVLIDVKDMVFFRQTVILPLILLTSVVRELNAHLQVLPRVLIVLQIVTLTESMHVERHMMDGQRITVLNDVVSVQAKLLLRYPLVLVLIG